MRARLEIDRNRAWLEILLAIVGVIWVAWVLFLRPSEVLDFPIDHFTHFPLAIGLAVWLPLLARTRTRALGDLRVEGSDLVLEGRFASRRIPAERIRGVRVAKAARGASVVLALDDDSVIAAALDDLEDARRIAEDLRAAGAKTGSLSIRSDRFGSLAAVLRPVTSLCALGYYLYVVENAIPGDKAIYGLSALFAAISLFVIHLARHGRGTVGAPAKSAAAPSIRGYRAAMRDHLELHAEAPDAMKATSPPRMRIGDQGERLGASMQRLRRDLASPEAYRGPAQGIEARLDQAFRSPDVPLRERAVALRILAASDRGNVRQRIAEIEPLREEDQAWLEEVALAEDDAAAIARIERRPPDFLARDSDARD